MPWKRIEGLEVGSCLLVSIPSPLEKPKAKAQNSFKILLKESGGVCSEADSMSGLYGLSTIRLVKNSCEFIAAAGLMFPKRAGAGVLPCGDYNQASFPIHETPAVLDERFSVFAAFRLA